MATNDANLFDITLRAFKKHIDAEHHHHVTFALWALHSHVYSKFEYTPRLSIQSPTPESGKSEVLKVLRFICPNTKLLINPTPATLFRLVSNEPTMLIDEVDNIHINRDILGILNKGHEKGGMVPRTIKNVVVEWPVFGAVAFGGIGTLPATLQSRSVVIPMYRANPDAKIVRLDINNMEQMQDLAFINELASDWAENVKLNPDPVMPDGFKGRKGNKWRVLFAIADNLGRGDVARKAACSFADTETHVYELMLIDICKVFGMKKVKVITNTGLVNALLELEESEYDWSSYKGRPLTVGLLAMALKNFGIQPKHIWLPEGRPRVLQKLHRTYAKADFEDMWKRYRVAPVLPVPNVTNVTTEGPKVVKLVKPKPRKKLKKRRIVSNLDKQS